MARRNLRKRPFLIVNQIARPSKGANTGKKGWMDEPDSVTVLESISIVDSVTNKHLGSASLILDVMYSESVKNSISPENTDEVITHYLDKYKKEIAEGTQMWMRKLAQDPVAAKRIVDEIEANVAGSQKKSGAVKDADIKIT